MDKAELLEKLRELDEVILIELLGATSTDIVDAFLDLIDERYNYIYEQIKNLD